MSPGPSGRRIGRRDLAHDRHIAGRAAALAIEDEARPGQGCRGGSERTTHQRPASPGSGTRAPRSRWAHSDRLPVAGVGVQGRHDPRLDTAHRRRTRTCGHLHGLMWLTPVSTPRVVRREQPVRVMPGADGVKTVILLSRPCTHDGIRIIGPPDEVDKMHGRAPRPYCAQDATDGSDPVGIGQGGDGCAVDVEQVGGGAASHRICLGKTWSRRRPHGPDLDTRQGTIGLQVSGSEDGIDGVCVERRQRGSAVDNGHRVSGVTVDRPQLCVGKVSDGVEQRPGHAADVVELCSRRSTRTQAGESDVHDVPTPDRLGARSGKAGGAALSMRSTIRGARVPSLRRRPGPRLRPGPRSTPRHRGRGSTPGGRSSRT